LVHRFPYNDNGSLVHLRIKFLLQIVNNRQKNYRLA